MTGPRAIPGEALAATASAWPEVRMAFGWVDRAAATLRDKKGPDGAEVRLRFRGLLGPIGHLREVTRGYRAGLFARYDTGDLPRTNNDPEQLFGPDRHHERRRGGRGVASPGMVMRGSVRLVAATASRLRGIEGIDLAPTVLAGWRLLRATLGRRGLTRAWGRRFRRAPEAYLLSLEAALIKSTLTS